MFTKTSLLATALLLAAAPAFAEGTATPAPTQPAVTSQVVSPETHAQTAKPTVTGHATTPERRGEGMPAKHAGKAPEHATGTAPVRTN